VIAVSKFFSPLAVPRRPVLLFSFLRIPLLERPRLFFYRADLLSPFFRILRRRRSLPPSLFTQQPGRLPPCLSKTIFPRANLTAGLPVAGRRSSRRPFDFSLFAVPLSASSTVLLAFPFFPAPTRCQVPRGSDCGSPSSVRGRLPFSPVLAGHPSVHFTRVRSNSPDHFSYPGFPFFCVRVFGLVAGV